MNKEPLHHPDEEDLMAFALHEGKNDIGEHVRSCSVCAATVAEFREVEKKISSLAEEDVPERLEQSVLRVSRHRPVHGHQKTADAASGRPFRFLSLLSNPVFISLLVMLLILVLYFLVGSEVFKVP